MTKESLNSSRTPSDGHLADTNPNSAQTLAASCSQPVLTLSQRRSRFGHRQLPDPRAKRSRPLTGRGFY